jgi:RNA polymerase sigma factor (sigma-70 family)
METQKLASTIAKPWVAVSTIGKDKHVVNGKAPVRDIFSFKKKEDREDIRATQKIMAGDANAFIQIWDRYQPWLVQKAFRMVNDHTLAEDIAIEVLGKAYKKIVAGAYQPTYTFNSWIMFMFKNHMVDFSRKDEWKNKGLTVSMDNVISDSEGSETSFSETMVDEDASSDSLILMNERRKIIREALAGLDDSSRNILGMYYGQQKDYQEISEELNINLNTLKVHMMRAKQKVKEFILGQYPELVRKEASAWEGRKLDSETKNIDGEDFTIFFAA